MHPSSCWHRFSRRMAWKWRRISLKAEVDGRDGTVWLGMQSGANRSLHQIRSYQGKILGDFLLEALFGKGDAPFVRQFSGLQQNSPRTELRISNRVSGTVFWRTRYFLRRPFVARLSRALDYDFVGRGTGRWARPGQAIGTVCDHFGVRTWIAGAGATGRANANRGAIMNSPPTGNARGGNSTLRPIF